MNRELLYVFFVALIFILLGHQYTAIAEQEPTIDQDLSQQLTASVITHEDVLPTDEVMIFPYPQTDVEIIQKESTKQNEDPWALRGVPTNEYINPKL